jgi:hypothetical protein
MVGEGQQLDNPDQSSRRSTFYGKDITELDGTNPLRGADKGWLLVLQVDHSLLDGPGTTEKQFTCDR